MEQGEIFENLEEPHSQSHRNNHDSSYEWPWGNTSLADAVPQELEISANSSVPSLPSPSNFHKSDMPHTIRLVVSRTRSIQKSHRVALLDGYTEAQLGRDVGLETVPKIRLREMEVSKLHATIYWDGSWNRWGIVDMGSKHGTFLRSTSGASTDHVSRGTRLSSARAASIPKRLYHLDEVTMGSTTFIVHIHADGLPCIECSPEHAENEIPLFPSSRRRDLLIASRGAQFINPVSQSGSSGTSSSKVVLSKLKRELLTRHELKKPGVGSYIDRSARRRTLYSSSKADAPGIEVSSTFPASSEAVEPPQVLSPPTATIPLSSSNVGHMLLVKQGWTPGTSLGVANEGRVDPLDVKVRHERAGLGTQSSDMASPNHAHGSGQSSELSWRKRYKRWPGPLC
ncbi:hypothetical protein L218DRAFT_896792 [Marasmius fiardii PR-910]|nr:hypothetical protein L218DRAFT_896792 [Marasmius fiardii PR-910]